MRAHIRVWGQDPRRAGHVFAPVNDATRAEARAWCEAEAPDASGYAFMQEHSRGVSGVIALYRAETGRWS
jgi:hypothetical protein